MSQTGTDSSTSTPTFRRGVNLRWFTTRFHYSGVNHSKATQAWRNLIDDPKDEIKKSRVIQKRMGVSVGLANKLRRLWHDLGLIENAQGQWNSDLYRYTSARSHIEVPDNENSEYDDFNAPARITILSRDPDAYETALAGMRPFVLNQHNPWVESHPLDNGTPIAYGDNGTEVPIFYVHGPRRLLRLSHENEQLAKSKKNSPVHFDETNAVSLSEVPMVIYIPNQPLIDPDALSRQSNEHDLLAAHHAEGVGVPLSNDRELTIEDVAKLIGKSVPTAYRQLPRLIEDGILTKVRRGRWILA